MKLQLQSKHFLFFIFLLANLYLNAQANFETASLLAKTALGLELKKNDPFSQVRNAREDLRSVFAPFFEGEGNCLSLTWTAQTLELDRQRQMLCQVERVLLGETANAYVNPLNEKETYSRSGGTVNYVWVKRAPSATLPNIISAVNSLNTIGGIISTPLNFVNVATISDTFSFKTGGFDNYYDLQNRANLKNWYNLYNAKIFIGVVENTFSDGYWGVTTIGNCATNFVNGAMVIRGANTNVSAVSLSIVMAHECGHFFGLTHDDPAVFPLSLMNPIVYDNDKYMSALNLSCIHKAAGVVNTDVITIANTIVKIYPTVVSEILNVENAKSFDILNAFGQIMLKDEKGNALNLEHLSAGLYFVQGADLNSVPFSQKFIKE